jgi:hypothetical protein
MLVKLTCVKYNPNPNTYMGIIGKNIKQYFQSFSFLRQLIGNKLGILILKQRFNLTNSLTLYLT